MSVILKTHTLTQLSQDITNNTSQVRYLVQLQTTGGSFNDNNITTTYYIDGVRYTKTHKLPKTSTTTVVDRTVTITHNADGTRSVDASFSTPTQISAGTMTGSKSLTLSTIPRASSITVNDANIGSATNIVINKASANFTTTLWYKTDSDNDWIKIVDKTSNQVYGWTVPTSFYAKIPNNKTIVCYFKADTYNGDTYIGTSSNVSATFTATGNPIINSVSAEDTNSTTIAQTGDSSRMILYASNVRIRVSASGQNSASISSIKVNGSSVSNGEITFYGATTNTFNIEVIDSRGYPTSRTITMSSVNYVPLTINATIKRNQPTDGKVNINLSGNYFNGSFGNQNNTLTVQYRYKESTSSTWGNWTNLTPTISGNTYSGSTQLTDFDYDKSYNFEIRATDKIGTKTITGITVTKGTPVFWWDNDEFNVNGRLDVSGNAIISGNTQTNGLTSYSGMELHHATPYIDFHYNNSSSDYTNRIIENESGKLEVSGKMQIDNGIFSRGTGQVGTPVGNSCLIVKRATNSEAPNNGVVLEFGNSTSWTGQLYIGDNADQGVYYNGWSNGVRGSWKRLAFENQLPTTTTGTGVVNKTSGANITSSEYRRYGNIVELFVGLTTTSSTSVGGDCFKGSINNSSLYPPLGATTVNYNGSSVIIGSIGSDGSITVRICGSSLASGKGFGLRFTYVI